jgi:hypothetical protein
VSTHNRRDQRSCPFCKKSTDCDSQVNGDGVPEVGDVSVCFYCGQVALFTEGGLRKPSDEERSEILADPDVTAAVGAVLAYRGTAS